MQFDRNDTTRDIIVCGWDRPLSQLFCYVGSETKSAYEFMPDDVDEWLLDEQLKLDKFIYVPNGDVTTECLNTLKRFIENGHAMLEQPMSDDVITQLLELLKEDAKTDLMNVISLHAINGQLEAK